MTNNQTLTQAVLKSMLLYNADTGEFKWQESRHNQIRAGHIAGKKLHPSGYRFIYLLGKTYKASRLAWLYTYGHWPKEDIDHINRDKADDRIVNLRNAARQTNARNTSKQQIETTGIYYRKDCTKNPWLVYLTIDGRQKSFGHFKTKELAIARANQVRRKRGW